MDVNCRAGHIILYLVLFAIGKHKILRNKCKVYSLLINKNNNYSYQENIFT